MNFFSCTEQRKQPFTTYGHSLCPFSLSPLFSLSFLSFFLAFHAFLYPGLFMLSTDTDNLSLQEGNRQLLVIILILRVRFVQYHYRKRKRTSWTNHAVLITMR